MSDQYDPRGHRRTVAYYPTDINEFVSAFIRSLHDRSQKAASETATGSMIINTFTEFVVGQGLEAQSSPENSVLNWTEEQRSRFMTQAESLFRMYAGSRRIDHYGKMNFYQAQKVAFRNGMVEGDFLLRRSYRNGHHDYEPYFQILSGRWVRNPNMQIEDTTRITGGVEFDEAGREIAYYIAQVLSDRTDAMTSKRVLKYNPASGFEEYNLVRFGIREANQVRGISCLTPVLEDIFDFETFKTAYKAKAATQALFTGVITSEKDAPAPSITTVDAIKSMSIGNANQEQLQNTAGRVDDISLGSGNIIQLNSGEKMEMVESKTPGPDFSHYSETELSHIAAGCGAGGLAYEMILLKFNNNYSASRATIAGQEKKFKNLRNDLAEGFCTPVWEQVIDWGIRCGLVEAPGYIEGDWRYRKAVLACTWIGPSPISIDPRKEVEAHIMAIREHLEPKEDAVRELYGKDYEENFERILREVDMEKSLPQSEQAEITMSRDAEEEYENE